MASVIFIQNLWYEFPGVGILSAVLKKNGHNAKIIISDSPANMLGRISANDIIAFSIMTGMQRWAVNTAAALKKEMNLLSIFGGPYPTYSQGMIDEEGVDIICIGEGEGALLDLANAVDRGTDITSIKNLWVKKSGIVHKNPLRPLIEDLDTIPFADRKTYYETYPALERNSHKIFLAGRGCPFDCTFCFNEKLKNMYAGLGQYVRFRSPVNIIEEIKQVRQESRLKTVFFNDDIFVLNQKWLNDFLPLYKEEIDLPFYVTARADTLNEPVVKLLKDAGCKCVSFAVESGNERIRNEVLGKKITDEQIIKSAALLKKYRIKFATYNMIGIPGETVDNVLETVNINIKIKTDYPRCSFLTPYPGTRIAKYAEKTGHLESTVDLMPPFAQQTSSSLKLKDKNEIINMHSFFQTAVKLPFLMPAIRIMAKLPENVLFKIWWATVYFIIFSRSEGRGLGETLSFFLNSRASFFNQKSAHI